MRKHVIWVFMGLALIGGALLVSAALDQVLSVSDRGILLLGLLSVGAGQRMLHERLHERF